MSYIFQRSIINAINNLSMNFRLSFLKLNSNQWRLKSSNSGASKINHYDSLGISPKSTQSEIKTAYYALSMMYHPDKNNNEASLQKFRNITEAYEVLGNASTRKMYDKGLYFRTSVVTDDTINKFYKSRENRSRPPPPDGKTPIYDFDEWAKSHYGTTFKRQMENKRRSQEYQEFRQKTLNDQKLEQVVFGLLAMVFLCMLYVNQKKFDFYGYGDHQALIKKQTKDE